VYPAAQLQCPGDGTVLPLEGRLLGGKFQLDRRVGDGGMASVWQATNTLVHRTVAIKLMHARYAGDAELLSRFRNEASAAGRIGSPYICDVLDFGESEIGPFIVMELLEGCSLADLIQAHRRLDPGLAVWILRQALEGLEAAHRVGIVHRDLKPENIFLCRAIRGQWLVKLMDFGISKFAHAAQTEAGATMGTPHYMAPEQIQRAATVDARADLWSIGVILHESITGVQLFARDNVADGLAALRSYDPPSIRHYVPDAPAGLAEIVARCLQRDPARRFPSASILSQALRPFERPGARATTLLDAETAAVPRAATTMRRSGAAPRALLAPLLPPPTAKAGAQRPPSANPVAPSPERRSGLQAILPPPTSRAPSGVHAPVAAPGRAPSGAHPPVLTDTSSRPPARAGSGVHAQATRTGAQPAVMRTGAQPAVPRTGAQPAVSGAQPAVPRTGAQPAVPRTGAQPAVPRTGAQPAVSRTGAQPAVSRTGAQPAVMRTGAQPAVPRTGAQPAVPRTGAQPAVPRTGAQPAVPRTGSHAPAARAAARPSRPVPSGRREPARPVAALAPVADPGRQTWIWGALLALLGGGAMLFALLRD
jgi:serine/threonine-protein kinase